MKLGQALGGVGTLSDELVAQPRQASTLGIAKASIVCRLGLNGVCDCRVHCVHFNHSLGSKQAYRGYGLQIRHIGWLGGTPVQRWYSKLLSLRLETSPHPCLPERP
jgi:hypothetical protein